MLDAMKYVNHKNEIVEFGSGFILINENKLRDYEWAYLSDEVKLSTFSRKRNERKLPGFVYGEDRQNILNYMSDVFEVDIRNETPGTLYINGYYTKGYFISFEKSGYTKSGSVDFSLSFVSTSKIWISETKHSFYLSGTTEENMKTYAGRYSYRYGASSVKSALINPSRTASDFKMVISGPTTNPSVTIGENTYMVYLSIEAGEQIEINTSDKTVYKISKYGERENAFHYRQKTKTFFSKVSPGRQEVVVPGGVSVEVTLYEERSEPKW